MGTWSVFSMEAAPITQQSLTKKELAQEIGPKFPNMQNGDFDGNIQEAVSSIAKLSKTCGEGALVSFSDNHKPFPSTTPGGCRRCVSVKSGLPVALIRDPGTTAEDRRVQESVRGTCSVCLSCDFAAALGLRWGRRDSESASIRRALSCDACFQPLAHHGRRP